MLRWLIGSSLEFRIVVLGLAVALLVIGAFRVREMPVDVFPEFEAPTVKIQTEALGLSAEEVESLVTLNLEELLSGVPWLESIRSESVTGLSSIVLKFERGTDITRARQMVQERLALAIYLPNVAQPPAILQPTSATSRFMMIGLSSDEIEKTDLSMLARWTIMPKLTGIPGVANVSIWGQRLKQMQVQVDPRRLRDARVLQEDILRTAGDALWVSPLTFLKGSTPGTGGWIDNRNQRLGVLHRMPITTPEDMAQVPVAPKHLLLRGQKMRLGEVAEVTFGHPPLIGDAFVNNTNGLMLVVEKFPAANTLEVTADVEKVLRELQRGLPGVKVDARVFRLATYIEESMETLNEAVIAGAILVVVGAFLFNWRTALISLVSIPLSLMAAVVVLSLTGATFNTMILAGLVLALGVVIDDAIVGVDRLTERLRQRAAGDTDPAELTTRLILRTTLETRGPTVYAALIILLAIMPVLFMGGASGAFFTPLAASYALAVAASLVVGLTVTPALSLILFGGTTGGTADSPVAAALRKGYTAVLRVLVRVPRIIAAAAVVLVVVGIAIWPLLGQSLLPTLKEQDLMVSIATAPGTSHQETYRIASRLSQELEALPGIRSAGAHVGRAITGDQVVGINSAQIWLGIDSEADHDATVAQVRDTIAGYPGLDRSVQTYLRNTVSEALTGETDAVVVRIYGQKREVLSSLAEDVRQALSDVDGLVDLRAAGQVEEPQLRVSVDLEKASAANVTPGEVRRSAATVFSGLTVGFLYEEQKIYDVVVWGTPEVRESVDDLRNVLVEKSDRHHVRLADVADVSIEPTPIVIRHDGIAPYIDVVANVAGRDLGAVNRDVEARLAEVNFPLEYYPQILGEFVEREDAQQRTRGLALTAAIGIFLLLQACFRSWRLAFLGFLALPAALTGGVLAVLAGGGLVTLGALVAFFAVLGIAARNGILLITHFQRLEAEEGVPFGRELVVRGARERVAPIIASSAAIIAALLPAVIFGDVPGLEIVSRMAAVIIGGTLASVVFTVLVVPPLYLLLGARANRQQDDLGMGDAGPETPAM